MINGRINSWVLLFVAAIIVIGSFSIVSGAGFIEPGSEDDPVVTLSYVELRIDQIKYYIDQNLEALNNSALATNTEIGNLNTEIQELKTEVEKLSQSLSNTNTSPTGTSSSFEVLFIEAGRKLVLGESTEVIWRSGKASAIASNNGGLSDVTIGKDLKTGDEIPLNHLIIIPRNDGRGMSVSADSYIMVKGSYTIQ